MDLSIPVSLLNEYFEIVQGNRGVFDNGTMLRHYRETLTNINKHLLSELEDLFMQIWDIWE